MSTPALRFWKTAVLALLLFVGVTGRAESEAIKELQHKAEKGDAKAQNNLGYAYDNGEGVPKDRAEGVKWFRRSAEQGNAFAQHNLGVAYFNGYGVQKDSVESMKWWRKAAEQGFAEAQVSLGSAYYSGEGVPKDSVEAYAWWNIAAAKGHENAAKNRGLAEKEMTPTQIEKAQERTRVLIKELSGEIKDEEHLRREVERLKKGA